MATEPFAHLPADDFDQPDEPWFCEPPDDDQASEHDRQRRFVVYMHKHAPSVLVAAYANGGTTAWQKLRRWREGQVAGMPDLSVLWNHGAFYAEFKGGRGKPTREQRDVLNRLHRMGFRCGVYRRPETLIAHLREAGCPIGIGGFEPVGEAARRVIAGIPPRGTA